MKTTHRQPLKPAKATKPARRERLRPLEVGRDGRTANARYREALEEALASEQLPSEAALARVCDQLLEIPEHERPYVNQPMLSAFRNDKVDLAGSKLVTIVARGLGVEAVWLQYGAGPKHPQPEIAELAAALEARGLKVRKQ